MKQVFNLGGGIVVEDIPAPVCDDNEVMVQNAFSVISSGTESSTVKGSSQGIIGLARRVTTNPQLIQQAIQMARKEGLKKTLNAARGQIEAQFIPLGYCSSGTVVEVGKSITGINRGDRVACAGAGYACHAEFVTVPQNLVCRIPNGVGLDEAAFTTLGAIAMQGVRRAQVEIGNKVVVIGLGLLGQITCQILVASGTNVIGIDPIASRVNLARELGASLSLMAGENAVSQVLEHTGGTGADSVIICAATQSSQPVNQAMQMARKKAKIVVVGAVGMELERTAFYEKELDFLISTSYGPGRYDPVYEEKGIDYPIGYVRWTENRNMQAFLELLALNKVNVQILVGRTFQVEEAPQAYQALEDEEKKPIAVVLKYPAEIKAGTELPRTFELEPVTKAVDVINVGVIGAGNFAQIYHLPNLKKLPVYNIRGIVTRTGTSAKNMMEKFSAQYCSTDYHEILKDKDVDMVLIATRHHLHAPLIIEAANVGKSIFVEKPIALSYEECRDIYEAVTTKQVNLTIGFNRRFSPLGQRMKGFVEKRKSPMVINVRVNSPGMTTDHWINDPVEGGGAIVGEACHFFDFTNWLVGAEPLRIYAEKITSNNPSTIDANNTVCTLTYQDGSVAALTYTTTGNDSFSKERIEIFVDGSVLAINDFRELTIAGLNNEEQKLPRIEKGQLELLQAYGRFLKEGNTSKDLPTVLDGIKATVCSLKVLDSIRTGKVQEFGYPR